MGRVIETNTVDDVLADSAYHSSKSEAWLKADMLKSRIHRRKLKGKPMPEHIARAKGKVRDPHRSNMASRTRRITLALPSAPLVLPKRRQSSRLPIWL